MQPFLNNSSYIGAAFLIIDTQWRVNTLFYNFLARCREKNDHLIFRGIATNGAYHWSVMWILIMESCFQKDIWGQGNLEIKTCFYWVSLEKLYHVNKLRFLQSAPPYIIFIIYIQSISLCALKAKTIKTTSYNLIILCRRSFSQSFNQSEENDFNCVTLTSLRKWRQNIFSCIL